MNNKNKDMIISLNSPEWVDDLIDTFEQYDVFDINSCTFSSSDDTYELTNGDTEIMLFNGNNENAPDYKLVKEIIQNNHTLEFGNRAIFDNTECIKDWAYGDRIFIYAVIVLKNNKFDVYGIPICENYMIVIDIQTQNYGIFEWYDQYQPKLITVP